MPTKRKRAAVEPSEHAEVPAGTPVRVRVESYHLLVDRSRKRPPIARLRKDLARAGIAPDVIDTDFLRALDRATDALLTRAFDDEAVLDLLGRDPVRAYRMVDPAVAARLDEISTAARAASIPPPDIGPLPKTRRPPPVVRPQVRSVALDAAVREQHATVVQWATEDPAHLARLREDPAGVLAELVPDAPLAVRQRLERHLGAGTGGRP